MTLNLMSSYYCRWLESLRGEALHTLRFECPENTHNGPVCFDLVSFLWCLKPESVSSRSETSDAKRSGDWGGIDKRYLTVWTRIVTGQRDNT